MRGMPCGCSLARSVLVVMLSAATYRTIAASAPIRLGDLEVTAGVLGFQPVADWPTWQVSLSIHTTGSAHYTLHGEFLAYVQALAANDWGGSGAFVMDSRTPDDDAVRAKYRLGCGQLMCIDRSGRIDELLDSELSLKVSSEVPMEAIFAWSQDIAPNRISKVTFVIRKPWIPPQKGDVALATPKFVSKETSEKPFRYWITIPSVPPYATPDASSKARLIAMDADVLLSIAESRRESMILRRTCLAWLADCAPVSNTTRLVTLVQDDSVPLPVREAATRALAWGGPLKGEESLIQLLSDRKLPSVLRQHIVYGLELLPTPTAKKVLCETAQTDIDEKVRQTAKSATESNRQEKAPTPVDMPTSGLPLRNQAKAVNALGKGASNEWPAGSGYLAAATQRPITPLKVSPTETVATIIGSSDTSFEIDGSVEMVMDVDTGKFKPLTVHPGAILTVRCKDISILKIKDFNGDMCTLTNGITVRVDEYGQFVPLRSTSSKVTRPVRIGDRSDAAKTPERPPPARSPETSRSLGSSLVFATSFFIVECESVQFASVSYEAIEENKTIALKGRTPSPFIAVVLLCWATGEALTQMGGVTEVPTLRIPGSSACTYEGFQGEFLTRQPTATPIWSVVEQKSGPREIHLGRLLSGQEKWAMPQGDQIRLKIAYRLPDQVVIPPDGEVELSTTQGTCRQPFPPAYKASPEHLHASATGPVVASTKEAQQKMSEDDLRLDPFGKIRMGDTKAKVEEVLGHGSSMRAGQLEVLIFPMGTIKLNNGLVTAIERKAPVMSESRPPVTPSRSAPAKIRSSTETESDFFRAAREVLPRYALPMVGFNEVRVRNPNGFSVVTGVRTNIGGYSRGKDFEIPPNGVKSVNVAEGDYDIYFVYSNDPTSMYKGDKFRLSGRKGIEIQIVKVSNGNYGIKKVK